jgi:hypothetical protein
MDHLGIGGVMELDDNIRLAVYREMCEQLGHDFNLGKLMYFHRESTMGGTSEVETKTVVGSREEFKFPHVPCKRCGLTYIVFPFEGQNYDDAESKLYEFLKVDSSLAKEVTRNKARRSKKNDDTDVSDAAPTRGK